MKNYSPSSSRVDLKSLIFEAIMEINRQRSLHQRSLFDYQLFPFLSLSLSRSLSIIIISINGINFKQDQQIISFLLYLDVILTPTSIICKISVQISRYSSLSFNLFSFLHAHRSSLSQYY